MDTQMILERKQRQREQGKCARSALSPDLRSSYSLAICKRIVTLSCFQQSQRILIYAAFGAEADLHALTVLAPEKQYFYPVCLPEHEMVCACPNGADGWTCGTYGIQTPILSRSTTIQPNQLDLVLVPCTAFDEQCRRVGMGAGYYDRYLARCTNATAIGVAFECQKIHCAITNELDWRLNGYVTERTFYHASNDTKNL